MTNHVRPDHQGECRQPGSCAVDVLVKTLESNRQPPPNGADRDARHGGDFVVGAAFKVGESEDTSFFGAELGHAIVNRVPVKCRQQRLPAFGDARPRPSIDDQQLLRTGVTPEAATRIDDEQVDAADQPGSHRIPRQGATLTLMLGEPGVVALFVLHVIPAVTWHDFHGICSMD